jgi:predicted ATPase
MRLKKLNVEGFRSFKRLSWEPGDLNVVIGPNASGKSNLLNALDLISALSAGRLNSWFVRQGGIESLLWNREYPGIEVSINANSISTLPRLYALTYLVEVNASMHGFYSIDREELVGSYKGKLHKQLVRNTGSPRVEVVNDREADIVSVIDAVAYNESALSQLGGPTLQNRAVNGMRADLANMAIYSTLRTDGTSPIRQAFVTRHDDVVARDGENFPSVLHTLYAGDRDFKRVVNDALSAAFDDFEELIFAPSASQRTEMRIRWKTSRFEPSATDLSDGTLRFLYLLAVLANPNSPPVIAIDEPETGLHPSMVSIVAGLCAEAALRTQVIVTTHSDEFLSAMGEYSPTVSVTHWENGETMIKVVDRDELAYWRKEYSLGSLYRSGQLEQMA